MISNKIIQKIYLKIDAIAKNGTLGKIDFDKYVDELVNSGQLYLLKEVLDRKYGITSATQMNVQQIKDNTYTTIRLLTTSTFQEQLKTIYDKSSVYQMGKDVYEQGSSINLGSITSYNYGITGSNLNSLPTSTFLEVLRLVDNSILELNDPNTTLTSKYQSAVDFLIAAPLEFITIWNTTIPNEAITLPYLNTGTYSGIINWGDGNTSVNSYNNRLHVYSNPGNHSVSITGDINGWSFGLNSVAAKNITSVIKWGQINLKSSGGYNHGQFQGCYNLKLDMCQDVPMIHGLTSLSSMFAGCSSLTNVNNINQWDVSTINDMSYLFWNTNFDDDISNWDVSNVTNMSIMFQNSRFNHNIGSWNVSNVTNMNGMFYNSPFNNGTSSSINNWSVTNVTNMGYMFSRTNFNQPIGNWDVSNVTNMYSMFAQSPFNQDISSWNVSNVNTMYSMFANTIFNQVISNWNVSGVTDMDYMFYNCKYNNLLSWDVSNVNNMKYMFAKSEFNQDISNWNVSNVVDMSYMFANSNFNQDISNWNVSNVVTMFGMFSNSIFNQNISGWTVSNVTNMGAMFSSSQFNQDIGSWNISNVTNFNFFMKGKDSTTFSPSNLDSIYNNWSLLPVQYGITISFGQIKYTIDGISGKSTLQNTYNWNITDGGLISVTTSTTTTTTTQVYAPNSYQIRFEHSDGSGNIYGWQDDVTACSLGPSSSNFFNIYSDSINFVEGMNVYADSIGTPLTTVVDYNPYRFYYIFTPFSTYQRNTFNVTSGKIANLEGCLNITTSTTTTTTTQVTTSTTTTTTTMLQSGSLLFDGVDEQYLDVPASSDFCPRTGDFTIEWFQNQSLGDDSSRVWTIGGYPDASFGVSIEHYTQHHRVYWNFVMWINTVQNFVVLGPIEGSWVHFAVCRLGGTVSVYQDGDEIMSYFSNDDINNFSDDLLIGIDPNQPDISKFNGYITNFHFVNGTALYTSNFTRPSLPITPVPDTKLLLLASDANDAFVDSSVFNRNVQSYSGLTWSSNTPF
jgi:surface protein